ncbi:hypothetical protein MKJ01_17850 [Chryseobacterium sp. SSA4.19]|uniref:hypothetical protein n=1 Tax=Chryseobacterium sp. SSA4.19 TaxID=2919915 RepID=UPI001F4DE6F2|nr:hypothetical protein [Chryseobacterium sp. SSA4.19]MCJ8155625.1 hypothetical protein [Chryseobacterium sp. SSA4.19]
MEDLKQETENIKTGLSKAISDLSDIVLDRFKNPYITAFSISWVAFNWKPIVFFIFSKGNIEYKINQITENYSDIWHYLYYPLISSLIFLFLVPYLNQLNEWFLRHSVRKRADYIKSQIVDKIVRDTDIAKALDNKEKAIRESREGAQYNEFVDSLKRNISDLEQTLHSERMYHNEALARRNAETTAEIKNIDETFEKRFLQMVETHGDQITSLNNEIYDLQNKLEIAQTPDRLDA